MKAPTVIFGWAATAHALMLPQLGTQQQQAILNAEVYNTQGQYLIETAPGETQWVTEDDKWDLRRQGINFMDITETSDLGISKWAHAEKTTVEFPNHPAQNKSIRAILGDVEESKMRENLEVFTAFHTRYYKSSYGEESSKWLLGRVKDIVSASDAADHGATVEAFSHPWQQSSVIARIPGRSNKTIVIGAHQDSINLFLPSILAAPGADDDGSGSVTILEALRVLLQDHDLSHGKAPNTLEFHWYSAEEGGLLGSQAIFSAYEKAGKDVRAMFHQDMTGYVAKTLEAGEPESFGVITDFVDTGLTDFIKKCIDAYCDIPYVLTRCGYACSDHASATKAGYPSAFVIESDFKYSDKKIHTTEDKIEYLSFSHMRQHAMLTLSLAYELTFHDF